MADVNGHVVRSDDGIWQKRTDGSPLQFTDSIGHKFSPPLLRADFEAWCKAGLISEKPSASAEHGVVFAITPVGLEAWSKLGSRRGLRSAAIGRLSDVAQP